MKNKALYYPYINVPKTTWISQQLLYLDKLGSIVPFEYIHNPKKLTPYMRDLVSAELVEQIFPAEYIPYNSEFEINFIALIRKKGYDRRKINNNDYAKIHIEKFGNRLKEELKLMNLLDEVDYPWCFVEKKTANLLMSYVASVIGMSKELSMRPITDNILNLRPFIQNNTRFNYKDKIIVLDKLIPVPEKPIPVSELSRFKEKNSNLLIQFRDEINEKINNVSLIKDLDTRNYEINKFINQSNEKIDEISKKMSEQKWGNINLGTISSLTAAAIPLIDIIEPNDIYKSIPGLVGAICSVVLPNLKNKKEILSEPLAYASYVKYRFYK